MIRRPPRSTLFPYTTALPIYVAPHSSRQAGVVRDLGPVLAEITRSEEHTSELQSRLHLVCRLLLEKKKKRRTASLPNQQATSPTSHEALPSWHICTTNTAAAC